MNQQEFDDEVEKINKRKQELTLASKIDNSIVECYDNTLAQNNHKMQSLTNKLFNAEVEVKEKQIEGRKAVLQAETDKEVTKAKTEVDKEKTERAKTILKAQGLTEKLPPAFRTTALVVGYIFFLPYLLTLGWVNQFITFVIKGFITMVFDCAEKYVELNKKFTENEKEFKLSKAIFNILKWTLLVAGIVVLVIFLTKN